MRRGRAPASAAAAPRARRGSRAIRSGTRRRCRGRAVLDQVAREQHPFLRQPDHRVALGVAAAELHDVDRSLPSQGQSRRSNTASAMSGPAPIRRHGTVAGSARSRFSCPPRPARRSGRRCRGWHDVLAALTRRAEHAHRVVVRQHDVPIGLSVTSRMRRITSAPCTGCLRVDHHHRVIADDDAGVGIAFGRVRVRMIGQLVEADLLFREVA